jgi:hypothetical protein
MSATDAGRNGDFYWDSTGEFFGIFDDWLEGEPALNPKFTCAYMSTNEPNINDTHRWRNQDCWAQYRYVCESVPTSKNLHSKSAAVGNSQRSSTANGFSFRKSYYEISMDKVYVYYVIVQFSDS